jgi:hypothetical protein
VETAVASAAAAATASATEVFLDRQVIATRLVVVRAASMEAVLVRAASAALRAWAVAVLAAAVVAVVALAVAVVAAVVVVVVAAVAAGGRNREQTKSDHQLNKLNSALAEAYGGCRDNGGATVGHPDHCISRECANTSARKGVHLTPTSCRCFDRRSRKI